MGWCHFSYVVISRYDGVSFLHFSLIEMPSRFRSLPRLEDGETIFALRPKEKPALEGRFGSWVVFPVQPSQDYVQRTADELGEPSETHTTARAPEHVCRQRVPYLLRQYHHSKLSLDLRP